jgi:hypothetical protein
VFLVFNSQLTLTSATVDSQQGAIVMKLTFVETIHWTVRGQVIQLRVLERDTVPPVSLV